MKDKLVAQDEAFKKYFSEGYPKRPVIQPFLDFLHKKYPQQIQQNQEDDEEEDE